MCGGPAPVCGRGACPRVGDRGLCVLRAVEDREPSCCACARASRSECTPAAEEEWAWGRGGRAGNVGGDPSWSSWKGAPEDTAQRARGGALRGPGEEEVGAPGRAWGARGSRPPPHSCPLPPGSTVLPSSAGGGRELSGWGPALPSTVARTPRAAFVAVNNGPTGLPGRSS